MPEGVGYSGSNVVAGTGLELNYIGNHCYAYGGEFGRATAEQTVMNFTTGADYIVGELFVSGGIAGGNASGGITTFQVKLNGITSIWLKVESAQEDQPSNTKCKFILPPYTTLTVISDSDATDATFQTTTAFTGILHK